MREAAFTDLVIALGAVIALIAGFANWKLVVTILTVGATAFVVIMVVIGIAFGVWILILISKGRRMKGL